MSLGHLLMLAAGILAIVLNLALLRSGDEPVPVVVAAVDLEPGRIVERSALAVQQMQVPGELAARFLGEADLASLDGRVVANYVASGDPLTSSDLRDPAAPGGLRAMSIAVDPAHAVGGALRPGDRVDVIEVTGEGARFIATGIEVLAVADRSAPGSIGGLTPYSVTVALNDDTALAVAAALRADAIELIRSTGSEPAGR